MPEEDLLADGMLHFNGVNGMTGEAVLDSMMPGELMAWIKGDISGEDQYSKEIRETVYAARYDKEIKLGPTKENVDELDLESAGWGAIYSPETPQEVKDALADLVKRRGGREYQYDPQTDQTAHDFRTRHGHPPGKVNPEYLPYYLLIVGPPTEIPFVFQYDLDALHAVGRVDFGNDAGSYSGYVQQLINYEDDPAKSASEARVEIFAPDNNLDGASYRSVVYLAKPLADSLEGRTIETIAGEEMEYFVQLTARDEADKAALMSILTRNEHRPALVFTATHGLWIPSQAGEMLQKQKQGALLCQEWPGKKAWAGRGEIPDNMFVAAQDLKDRRCDGMIVFNFACYSGGTPARRDIPYLAQREPEELASTAFISRLHQQLLKQGALACIGQIDKAWGTSFSFKSGDRQHTDIDSFSSTIEAILKGKPVGEALDHFNCRFLYLSQTYMTEYQKYQQGHRDEETVNRITAHWLAYSDARSYVLFGDPFISLDTKSLIKS